MLQPCSPTLAENGSRSQAGIDSRGQAGSRRCRIFEFKGVGSLRHCSRSRDSSAILRHPASTVPGRSIFTARSCYLNFWFLSRLSSSVSVHKKRASLKLNVCLPKIIFCRVFLESTFFCISACVRKNGWVNLEFNIGTTFCMSKTHSKFIRDP